MTTRHTAQLVRWLSVWACLLVSSAAFAAGNARVLIVTGHGVSDDSEEALSSAIATDAEAIDAGEYRRLARSKGLLPTSDGALQRVAPSVHADLIIVATKAGNKLHLQYRDGASGEVLDKEVVPAGRRGAAAAKLRARVKQSVHKLLANVSGSRDSGSSAPAQVQPVAAEPIAELPSADEELPPPAAVESDAEPQAAAPEVEQPPSNSGEPFLFEVSAGVGGATRNSDLPTRIGEHQLSTGLYPGVAIGVTLGGMLGPHVLLRAAADYRTSIGLHGSETQRAEMTTPLRSNGVGFGIEPGYRFGDVASSVSLLLHLGWYFRGLRPIAQLALPEMSWHAAVIRPELLIPLSGSVSLRLAPELLVVAGLETSLPDGSGIAHTGTGIGGEASLDIRVAAPVSLRIDYRESHVSLGTAWARNLTDVERFGALRVVLRY